MERLDRGDPRGIGRYRILARIGTGGTATVYLGRSGGGRAVAVKVMHADHAREPEFRARFRREVEAATTVGGVYSPPVLDADPDAARPWMATEFLPSVTLRDAVERYGPLPAHSVRRLAAGLAEALAAIHRTGIVHLDVKPANVLLTSDGPRLIDFGIAARTRSTVPAGSRGFMSPEQMAGSAGPPSDVYSLGATLAYACGGPDPGPVADEALRAVVADCGRPDPAARPTAAELMARLAFLTPHPEGPDTAWLPPQVTAAIDRQASAAANPPAPATASPPRRRLLLIGGTTVLAAAGGGAALLSTAKSRAEDGTNNPEASGNATPAASAPTGSRAPSSSPPPVKLEFVITGDGPLTAFTYWVNGRPTTLNSVPLTWRRSVEVPGVPGSVEWRLRFTLPSGRVRVRVYRDGSRTTDASHPVESALGFPDLYPYDVDMGGAAAISGPLPGADV